MSTQENAKKSRSQLTFAQKREICQFHSQRPHAKHQQIVDVFKQRYPGLNIERSTISKILKNKEAFLAVDEETAAKK